MQRSLCQEAASLANGRAREEFLDPSRYQELPEALASLLHVSLAILRHDWAPFTPDLQAPSGCGVKLNPEQDGLLRRLMMSDGSYARLQSIGLQAVREAMVNPETGFVEELLNDLLGDGPSFYRRFKDV